MAINKLTDATIRKLPERLDKQKRYADGGGLYLLIKPSGRSWVFRVTRGEKETSMGLGPYPDISLAVARERATEARRALLNGINPVEHKRNERTRIESQTITFEQVARQLFETKKNRCSDTYVKDLTRSMEIHVFPKWGSRPLTSITPKEAILLTTGIEKAGRYISHKMLARISEVFEYSISLGHIQFSPVNRATHKSLKPHDRENMASITFNELPELLKKFGDYRGYKITKLSFQFLMLTFIRTGELRQLCWSWLNYEKQEILIPANAMKAKRDHIIPLSKQALAILDQANELTGKYNLIFPTHGDYEKQASENTILTVLYSIGYKGRMTGHGFRSLARSRLAEEGFSRDALELQLAHTVSKDVTEAAYNRATFLDERRRMMQHWADLLDSASR